jgi:STAM-binding protein
VPPPLPPPDQVQGTTAQTDHLSRAHVGCACAPQSHAAPPPPRAAEPTSAAMVGFNPQNGLHAKLRTLRVPRDLTSRFLEVARPNTLANVETCGILAGTFRNDELHVTHVLVPNQSGSSDQCSTTDSGEEDACMYHVEHELITLGWIHTHPSQMCFFSSVDLHTQCGFQSMLDEAIGIVLAPKSSPSVGIFRLTVPSGLTEVQQCKESGFHPIHQRNGPGAGNGVYSESDHVVLTGDAPIQLVDLRK